MSLLYFVSVFPSLTETFIFREVQALRQLGIECRIGQLRPIGKTPAAKGFEDLSEQVISEVWRSPDVVIAFFYGLIRHPVRMVRCLLELRYVASDGKALCKASYVLMSALAISYRLRRERIEHIRAHYLHTESLAASFISKMRNIPYSVTCHTVKTHFPIALVRRIATEADFLVADTVQVKEFIIALGIAAERVVVIRNGIRLSGSTDDPMPAEKIPLILAVGRLDFKKGFHVLLDACSRLKADGTIFRCSIVGDGVQAQMLKTQAELLGLTGMVEFLGNLPETRLQRLYKRATILVVPSVVAPDGETDGLPTVIIEAMANGTSVVGTDTAAIPEIVRDGETGVLVRAGDPFDLEEAMRKCLGDESLRSKLQRNAKQLVEREYDIERNVVTLAHWIFKERPYSNASANYSLVGKRPERTNTIRAANPE